MDRSPHTRLMVGNGTKWIVTRRRVPEARIQGRAGIREKNRLIEPCRGDEPCLVLPKIRRVEHDAFRLASYHNEPHDVARPYRDLRRAEGIAIALLRHPYSMDRTTFNRFGDRAQHQFPLVHLGGRRRGGTTPRGTHKDQHERGDAPSGSVKEASGRAHRRRMRRHAALIHRNRRLPSRASAWETPPAIPRPSG